MQIGNTICYDCAHENACHKRREKPCKCEKKKTSKRTWWGGKPAQKKAKPRRRRKRVVEYDYDYGHDDRRCTCGEYSDSEYDSEEDARPRVVKRVRKVTKEKNTEKPRKRIDKRSTRGRARGRPTREPAEAAGDESDDSLLCQVSDGDAETECDEEAAPRDLKDALKDAVGWSRTLSKEDSDELGERAKGSNSSREFCRQSRHSV